MDDKKHLKWFSLLFRVPMVLLLFLVALVVSVMSAMETVGKARLEEQAYRLIAQTGNTTITDVYSGTVFAESLVKSLANMPVSEAVAASTSIYHTILLFIMGIITAVMFAGFAVLYKSFIRPLLSRSKQIQKTVESNAETPEHINISNEGKLGWLAHWFNQRSNQLAGTLAKLNGARFNLEKRVEERTKDLTSSNKQLEDEIIERKIVQNKLLESENRYHLIFDKANDSILLMNGDKFIDCNEKTLELFACTREQIIGKPPYLFSPPTQPDGRDSTEKALEKINAALAGRPQKFEWVHSKYDGTEFFAEVTLNVFSLKKQMHILAVVRDISERKQAEERINNSRKLLQRIIDLLPARVFWKDEKLRYLGCNESFAKDAGKNKPEDIIGKDDFQMSWKEQAEIYRNDDLSVMNSGKSKLNFEEPQTTPNGNKIWLKTSKVPLVDLQGNVIGILGTYEDITESKQAEETLRKRECYYRELINNTADAIFVYAVPGGRIIDCNNRVCTSLGYSREEMLCLSVSDIDANFSPDRDVKMWEELKPGMTATLLGFHKKKDGFVFPVEVNIVVVAETEGNIVVAVARDITERKQAEDKMKTLNEKLEEANQELKNFVYIASHDLKEPLRKISAFGTILQKSLAGKITGDDSENLNFMIDGSNRMTKMIEGLLIYSRVGTQCQPFQPVDLNEIINQLRQLELSMVLQEKQVVLDVPQPLPCVEADTVQIRQLMQNLIANGIKYQKKDNLPHITVTSKPVSDGMVRIEITDNGIGIAPEYQGAIFTMFKRLHSRSEYEGTGIGLAVCKKIVERYGGQIGIDSEPDKGSTFWFTVPAAKNLVYAST